MTKKGRLSKKEQAYIAEHSDDGVADIAEVLDRSEGVVSKELSKQEEAPELPKAGDLMARNEKYGSVTMTEQASMLGDESKDAQLEEDKPKEVNVSRRHRGAIHRIKDK
jgi:hypothetical protein|tara:strand:- start:2181 stop:2507 length:327 start_codon:yes stop_codon:yes gene_type:complete